MRKKNFCSFHGNIQQKKVNRFSIWMHEKSYWYCWTKHTSIKGFWSCGKTFQHSSENRFAAPFSIQIDEDCKLVFTFCALPAALDLWPDSIYTYSRVNDTPFNEIFEIIFRNCVVQAGKFSFAPFVFNNR